MPLSRCLFFDADMIDVVSMWKNPKMVAYVAVTAAVYFVVLYPFLQFSLFDAKADYLRVAVGVPAAFSFLFGPAAAWGAAFGNLVYDAATSGLNTASILGFLGNFLIAYIPYKLWTALTTLKPDMRGAKKVLLFMALSALSCLICGLVIGWGLFYLYGAAVPFVMTSLTIFASDALWAVVLGPVVLALVYGLFSKRGLLYGSLLGCASDSRWNRSRTWALAVFAASTILCYVLAFSLELSAPVLLPFIVASVTSVIYACR